MTQTDAITTAQDVSARRVERAEFPQRLRQWELVGLAGEGTLTRVYRARPVRAGADRPAAYALKMLRVEYQDDPRGVALLCREALVGRSVSHPHLISVLAAGIQRAPHYVVMPWLSGATLAADLAGGRSLAQPVAFWIARQVAEALAALCESGWLHGDVKPSNVFLSPEGHATLLDLGFARQTGRREAAVERWVAGTCNYLAPELLSSGHPVDVRSDVYSLGVVLFEMLSGEKPFRADNPMTVLYMHRNSPIPRLAPELAPLQPLIDRLLSKEVADRYADAASAVRAIEESRAQWLASATAE